MMDDNAPPPLSLAIQTQLYDKIICARDLFDRLFYDISPTKSINDSFESQLHIGSEDIGVRRERLSEPQCMAIQHISGFISSAVQYFEDSKIKQLNSSSSLLCENGERTINSTLLNHTIAKRKNDRTISLLQNFLTLEISRSEDLEMKVKELESELVKKTDEILRFEVQARKSKLSRSILLSKLVEPNIQTSNETSIESAPDDETEAAAPDSDSNDIDFNPLSIVGTYVRKQFGSEFFFGLIVKYRSPYFLIIYEDSDYEDLSKKETLSLRWSHSIPSAKIANCRKHAKKLEAVINLDEQASAATERQSNSNNPSSATKNSSNTNTGSNRESNEGNNKGSRLIRTGVAASSAVMDLTDHASTNSTKGKNVRNRSSSSSPMDEDLPSKKRTNSSFIVDIDNIDNQETVEVPTFAASMPSSLSKISSSMNSPQSSLFSRGEPSQSQQSPQTSQQNRQQPQLNVSQQVQQQPTSFSQLLKDEQQQFAHISVENVGSTNPMFCPSADTKVAKRLPVAQSLQIKTLTSDALPGVVSSSLVPDSSSNSSNSSGFLVRTSQIGVENASNSSLGSNFAGSSNSSNKAAASTMSGNNRNLEPPTVDGKNGLQLKAPSPPATASSQSQSVHLQNGSQPKTVFTSNVLLSAPTLRNLSPTNSVPKSLFHSPGKSALPTLSDHHSQQQQNGTTVVWPKSSSSSSSLKVNGGSSKLAVDGSNSMEPGKVKTSECIIIDD